MAASAPVFSSCQNRESRDPATLRRFSSTYKAASRPPCRAMYLSSLYPLAHLPLSFTRHVPPSTTTPLLAFCEPSLRPLHHRVRHEVMDSNLRVGKTSLFDLVARLFPVFLLHQPSRNHSGLHSTPLLIIKVSLKLPISVIRITLYSTRDLEFSSP